MYVCARDVLEASQNSHCFFVLKTSQIEYSVMDCTQRYVKWNCSWMCHKTHSQLTLLFHTIITGDMIWTVTSQESIEWRYMSDDVSFAKTDVENTGYWHNYFVFLSAAQASRHCHFYTRTLLSSWMTEGSMQATQSLSYSLLIHWHQAITIMMLTIITQGSNTRWHKGQQEGIRESKWQLCKLSVVYR